MNDAYNVKILVLMTRIQYQVLLRDGIPCKVYINAFYI